MLKPALLKYGHVKASDGFHSARNNFAFECVKLFHAIIRQSNERDPFRNFNHVGLRERAEAVEAITPRWRVSAHVAATQSAAVSERMLDAAHTPAFLVKHRVVHHAANS